MSFCQGVTLFILAPSNLSMPTGYALGEKLIAPLHMDCEILAVPLLTVAPVSPLECLFMRSIAIVRSRSLKKVVDSGRLGKKNIVKIPSITAGMPC